MQKKSRKLFVFFVIMGLASSLVSSTREVSALSGWNLLLIPNKKEYFANPGDQIRGVLKVRNDGDTDIAGIVPFAKDFTSNDQETGDPRILDDADEEYRYRLASWMEFSQEPVNIPAAASVDFEYVINVPENAEPGGHYAILYMSQVNPADGQTSMGVLSQIGSLILLTVSGDVDIEGGILEFFAGKKLYEYLPVDIYLRMQNIGNVHYRPSGSIFIHDWRDRQVGIVAVNETRGVVLPESIRKYQSFWSESFITDQYKMDADGNVVRDAEGEKITELKIDWSRWNLFRIGKYTAKAIIVFDDETGTEQQLIATTTFWVIPWRLILIAIALIALIVWGLIRLNRWYNKRLIEKYETLKQTEHTKQLEERKQWKSYQRRKKEKKAGRREKIRQAVANWFGNIRKNNNDNDKDDPNGSAGPGSLRWQ